LRWRRSLRERPSGNAGEILKDVVLVASRICAPGFQAGRKGREHAAAPATTLSEAAPSPCENRGLPRTAANGTGDQAVSGFWTMLMWPDTLDAQQTRDVGVLGDSGHSTSGCAHAQARSGGMLGRLPGLQRRRQRVREHPLWRLLPVGQTRVSPALGQRGGILTTASSDRAPPDFSGSANMSREQSSRGADRCAPR